MLKQYNIVTSIIFYSFLDYKGRQHHLGLVLYKFDSVPEHEVKVRSHGNAKSNVPYCRIMKSTVDSLKNELKSSSPKDSITKVMKSKGGLISAHSAGELPLSQQKVYDINRQMKVKSFGSKAESRGKGHDLLYVIMEQCKQTDKTDRYIQEVTCAPEPMAVLATQQQLFDLERFCCSNPEFCIMGVDPTFNLGEFSVTPIVYQHLFVQVRTSRKSPWLLGPLLIHYRKEFRNYNFFFSSLVGLRRSLMDIKAGGTDGEKNIIEALKTVQRHRFITMLSSSPS